MEKKLLLINNIFSELIKSGNYCYGSSYSGAIKTPYDPTSTTILNPYGQIVYNGEVYDIDVPALRYRIILIGSKQYMK